MRRTYPADFRRVRSLVITLIVALFLSSNSLQHVQAAAGELDPTFGTGGKVTTDFGGEPDDPFSITVKQSGKIVAAGYRSADFALAQYNPDGSLDSTFGSGGKVVNSEAGSSIAEAVAVQHDGKIVAVGTRLGFFLVRYNSDGSLDSSFGTGGLVETVFGGIGASAHGVAIQPDRKIIAVGITADKTGHTDFALSRYSGDNFDFDLCLQDDTNGNLLRFNSTTGDYQFTNCSGITLGGTGVINRRGGIVTLQQYGPDRRVLARIDSGVNRGTASVQILSTATTFTVTDRNTLNNTCSCGAH